MSGGCALRRVDAAIGGRGRHALVVAVAARGVARARWWRAVAVGLTAVGSLRFNAAIGDAFHDATWARGRGTFAGAETTIWLIDGGSTELRDWVARRCLTGV